MDKKTDYLISVKLAGYKSEDVKISRTINGWVWGNLVMSGLELSGGGDTPSHPLTQDEKQSNAIAIGVIGIIVDGVTGNMWQHYPTYINLDLTKVSSLPDTITANYPITLVTDMGKTINKTVPLVFHKTM